MKLQLRKESESWRVELPAHRMNLILEQRRKAGLEVFNFNQGLIRPPRAVQGIKGIPPQQFWAMGPVPGIDELRELIAEWRSTLFAEKIGRENVLITAGANAALTITLLTLSSAGDGVILPTPFFFNHFGNVLIHDRKPICHPLLSNGTDFALEVTPELLRMAKLLVTSSPHNPTGSVFSSEVLKKLAKQLRANDNWLVVDESYAELDLREPAEKLRGLAVSDMIHIGSLSKTVSLADLRLGYIIASPEIIERTMAIQDTLYICPSIHAQRIASRFLRLRPQLFPQTRARLQKLSTVLDANLREIPWIERCNGYAGPFKWVKLRHQLDDRILCEQLAWKTGVITTPGSAYGSRGWLRFAFGMLSEQERENACNALQKFSPDYFR